MTWRCWRRSCRRCSQLSAASRNCGLVEVPVGELLTNDRQRAQAGRAQNVRLTPR